MIIKYQTGDLVEYKGLYWTIVFCNVGNESVDLRTVSGRFQDEVSMDLIVPCPSTLKSATITLEKKD